MKVFTMDDLSYRGKHKGVHSWDHPAVPPLIIGILIGCISLKMLWVNTKRLTLKSLMEKQRQKSMQKRRFSNT